MACPAFLASDFDGVALVFSPLSEKMNGLFDKLSNFCFKRTSRRLRGIDGINHVLIPVNTAN